MSSKCVLFRVDSSLEMGTGHIMRCLTLAEELKREGFACYFFCRDFKGSKLALIKERGYELCVLKENKEFKPNDLYEGWLGATSEEDAREVVAALASMKLTPDLVIVDHYGIDSRWEELVKKDNSKLLVIDDLANRPHSCDLLVDQTLDRDSKDYEAFVPSHCIIMSGSNFSLLRREFSDSVESSKSIRSGSRNEMLVNMGGTDPKNITEVVLKNLASARLPDDINITVIGISENRISEKVIKEFDKRNISLSFNEYAQGMVDFILEADIAIGAPGATSWERCCLGLPSITIQTADNQKSIAKALDKNGASVFVGSWESIDFDSLTRAVEKLLNDEGFYSSMVESCYKVCDGKGALKVVKNIIKNI